MKIAIVGTGIAGLSCAYFLKDHCDVSVFEQSDRAGGHSHTIEVDEDGKPVRFDTGFMVFNERTYPLLTRLLSHLAVETRPASMSFSVQHQPSALEFNGGSLDLLFVQRRNLIRPRHYRMLSRINRFNGEAPSILADPAYADFTLKELVEHRNYGEDFLQLYLLPMSSAVWSAPGSAMLDFPAMTLLRFFHNHGFLGLHTQHPWRTPARGSRAYVDRITARLGGALNLRRPVRRIVRDAGGIQVTFDQGSERFDKVVLACHADESLSLLADPTAAEANALGCFRFQKNDICVHHDTQVMPSNRRAWASWNYRIDARGRATTHYWMNRLQSLEARRQYFVSLNSEDSIDERSILRRLTYHHPLFDGAAIGAQSQIVSSNLAPSQSTLFAGAWTRYGFHEDGLMSGLDCARAASRLPLWQ